MSLLASHRIALVAVANGGGTFTSAEADRRGIPARVLTVLGDMSLIECTKCVDEVYYYAVTDYGRELLEDTQ